MVDKQEIMNQIAKIMQNNLGNRISVELANGILQEIQKFIPELEVTQENVHNSTADSGAKE